MENKGDKGAMKDDRMFSSVYLMKLTSKHDAPTKETLFKIGISNNVDRRAGEIAKVYDVEVIDTIELPIKDVRRLENTLHSLFFKFRYQPLHQFGGKSECFQNKTMFRVAGEGYLKGQWDAIDDEEIKNQYYKDKAAREYAHKKRYWASKSRWRK